jgi:hypothetical protein
MLAKIATPHQKKLYRTPFLSILQPQLCCFEQKIVAVKLENAPKTHTPQNTRHTLGFFVFPHPRSGFSKPTIWWILVGFVTKHCITTQKRCWFIHKPTKTHSDARKNILAKISHTSPETLEMHY